MIDALSTWNGQFLLGSLRRIADALELIAEPTMASKKPDRDYPVQVKVAPSGVAYVSAGQWSNGGVETMLRILNKYPRVIITLRGQPRIECSIAKDPFTTLGL